MADLIYMAKSKWRELLDTIRTKGGTSASMTADQAIAAVEAIPSGGGGSALPDEYQEVEYIENTNTAMIDTGWKALTPLEIEIVASFNGGQSTAGILLGPYSNAGNWFGISTSNVVTLGGGNDLSNVTYSAKNKYIVTYASQTTGISVVCGNETASRSGSVATQVNVFLFSVPTKTNNCKAKIYSARMKYSDSLVRAFVPCYNKTTSEIGMYDVINRQFYGNANNSGNFTKGPDVLTASEALAILLGGDGE